MREMTEAYICAALRTAVVERSGIDPLAIDDVILGCTNQAGEDNRNVARMALLLAGLPVEVPGQTVNRLCGSGLQAAASAAQAVKAGEGDVFIAGGVESMTRAPYVTLKSGEPCRTPSPSRASAGPRRRSKRACSPTSSCPSPCPTGPASRRMNTREPVRRSRAWRS